MVICSLCFLGYMETFFVIWKLINIFNLAQCQKTRALKITKISSYEKRIRRENEFLNKKFLKLLAWWKFVMLSNFGFELNFNCKNIFVYSWLERKNAFLWMICGYEWTLWQPEKKKDNMGVPFFYIFYT